jgi:DNA-binding NarL/FixJ family response regulator
MEVGVLIVEDELLIAFHLQDLVEEAGLRVAGVARNTKEAIEAASQRRPAFAMMDMRLDGGSSGLEAARILFETWKIRSIFLSANLDDRARDASRDLQPLGYIGKPFLPSEVAAALARAARETSVGE